MTNRKSRSLFSGAKRWFGQGKPGVATGTSVIYGREAPELQLRKLGKCMRFLSTRGRL